MHIVLLFISPVTQMMIWKLNTIWLDKLWSFGMSSNAATRMNLEVCRQMPIDKMPFLFIQRHQSAAEGSQHDGWTPTWKFLKSPGLCHVEEAWGEEVRTSGQLSDRSVRRMFIQQSVRELVVARAWAREADSELGGPVTVVLHLACTLHTDI